MGSTDPKGMYNVGLPSGKTLFQIQAERLVRLQNLVKKRSGKDIAIPWYIMTSDGDIDSRTKGFFKQNNYFGLKESQIVFFLQGSLPSVTPDGKLLLEKKNKLVLSPNGNGDIWRALDSHNILKKWKDSGIKWICSYCVDNILVKMADPIFLGFCIENKLDIGAKVVPKLYPEERVGVLALKNNRYTVLEYSEIDEANRLARDSSGNLLYNASHLVINNYSLDFIISSCNKDLPYHVAQKIIPYINDQGNLITPTQNNGWKFELFAFDIFEYANKMLAFETKRNEEFSPLKNSDQSAVDNPTTCRQHLSDLHKSWVEAAGGKFSNSNQMFEISPLLSYFGEDLEKHVSGQIFDLPFHLHE